MSTERYDVVDVLVNLVDVIDINAKNAVDDFALYIACEEGHTDIVNYLQKEKENDRRKQHHINQYTITQIW